MNAQLGQLRRFGVAAYNAAGRTSRVEQNRCERRQIKKFPEDKLPGIPPVGGRRRSERDAGRRCRGRRCIELRYEGATLTPTISEWPCIVNI